ncbi:MAG: ankyrin repeat domain-containing protein [Alphaproteobacteria bacterium]|nr:ankyrin repeat domain-containing protein [Alphaproteobacteria bacterium]
MVALEAILAAEKPDFARAVRAIITGNAAGLAAELAANPELVRTRSQARHQATLLHYVSANGIEEELQSPVPNGDALAAILLAAGAEVDAQLNAAEAGWSTTLGLVASSDHPQEAGTAGRLVALLCSAGAAVDGPARDGSPLATALAFGTLDCADVLIARGARTENPIFAAAAGRIRWLRAWLEGLEVTTGPSLPAFLPLASDRRIAAEQALVFAAMCGQTEVVRFLLDRGVDIHSSPPGSHWTATPLHTAAGQGQTVVVDLLLRRGADWSRKDERHRSTPVVWTKHARPPRRALAQVVAKMLERASPEQF